VDAPVPPTRLTANIEIAKSIDSRIIQGWFHRVWERKVAKFTVLVVLAVLVASAFEIIPTFLIRSNVPSIASVQPYTPLELAGRDIYISEGCYNCHSQMIRPLWDEKLRYGEFSKPGEFVYDHPFQWGSRRIGPDLAREGIKNPSADWHARHFRDPREINAASIMPSYGHLFEQKLDFESIPARVRAMAMLNVPYGEAVKENRAAEMARAQAAKIGADIEAQKGPAGLADKKVVALIAYMQRLGTDLTKPPPGAAPSAAGEAQPTDGSQPVASTQ
jgi:cytochrome c oxidase cbb3-type subunit I/II